MDGFLQKCWMKLAQYIGIHPAQVREVASFYTMYNLKPVGKYHAEDLHQCSLLFAWCR